MIRRRTLIASPPSSPSCSSPAAMTTTPRPAPPRRPTAVHRRRRPRRRPPPARHRRRVAAGTDVSPVVAGEPFPEDRCAANEAAGTITYLSGFDFAATASIIDVVVADAAGYYEDLCLDVELTAQLLDRQLPDRRRRRRPDRLGRLVQRGRRLRHRQRHRARGRRRRGPHGDRQPDPAPGAADGAGGPRRDDDRRQGQDPAERRRDARRRRTRRGHRLRDGADGRLRPASPSSRWTASSGSPGTRATSPGTLERAGIAFDLFDPTEYDVPGSFGVLFTTPRSPRSTPPPSRTSCGRRWRPGRRHRRSAAATQTAIDLVEANGNPSFLSLEGESFRWETDAASLTPRRRPAPASGSPTPGCCRPSSTPTPLSGCSAAPPPTPPRSSPPRRSPACTTATSSSGRPDRPALLAVLGARMPDAGRTRRPRLRVAKRPAAGIIVR